MEAFSQAAREKFAAELKAWIEAHNMTQAEFAKESGLSASMVSNWLNCSVLPEELTRLYAVSQVTHSDVFKWVSILIGEEYRYENATRALQHENDQLKIERAQLEARLKALGGD